MTDCKLKTGIVRTIGRLLCATFAITAIAVSAQAQDAAKSVTLINNARIFDGHSDKLTAPMSVLIDGNKITKIAASITAPPGAVVIDAGGRTMSPGFMDAHAHIMWQQTVAESFRSDAEYTALFGAQMAKLYLSRGYTTIRDVGGNDFALRRAIDKGLVEGPRIYSSGAFISQSGGHGDLRLPTDATVFEGGQQASLVKFGHAIVVDGVPDVMKAVRENLRKGASQIKLVAGGGAASESDPLDVVQYTPEEMRAAVQVATDWGTYVTVHAYTPAAIRRAVEAGVKCVEHGNLIDEAAMQLMKEKGIWLSPQVTVYTNFPKGYTPDQYKKFELAKSGIDKMFTTAKKIGFDRIGFGTDIIVDAKAIANINEEFVLRKQWFSNAEILKQATSNNGQLVALSGARNPYPGKLGVIEEGALADLLLINGNPLADISILTNPEANLALIMKDGKVYKNLIAGGSASASN